MWLNDTSGRVLHELRGRWPIHQILSSQSSSTDNGFDAVTIVCRRKALSGAGRVQQLGYNDWPVDVLQSLVVHAAAAQNSDDV